MPGNFERSGAVVEQRRSARYESGLAARIVSSYGKPISCRIADRSEGGARLVLYSVFGVPDQFALEINETGERFSARVVWRDSQQLGVVLETIVESGY